MTIEDFKHVNLKVISERTSDFSISGIIFLSVEYGIESDAGTYCFLSKWCKPPRIRRWLLSVNHKDFIYYPIEMSFEDIIDRIRIFIYLEENHVDPLYRIEIMRFAMEGAYED